MFLLSLNFFWIGELACFVLKSPLTWGHWGGQYRTLPSSFSGWVLSTPCTLHRCFRPISRHLPWAQAPLCNVLARSTLSRHFADHTVCRLEQLGLWDNVCEFLAPIFLPHYERMLESQHWSTVEIHLSLGSTAVAGSQSHPVRKKTKNIFIQGIFQCIHVLHQRTVLFWPIYFSENFLV